MKTPLHIAIFDGSFKTTPFINRLIVGLSKTHEVSVFGFNEHVQQKVPNVKYVALGSSSKTVRLFWISIGFAFKVLCKQRNVPGFFGYLGLLFSLKKQQLQQRNLNTAVGLLRPTIFHVQWPSLLQWCAAILKDENVKVVLSQRGYQNNVRPFVNAENFEFLKTIYPHIDGFHSVSKAMVEVSNKIHRSREKIDRVVYSGFDFNLLPYSDHFHRSTELKIISIGRPHWKKGFNYALEALKIVVKNGGQIHYTIIGGSGNEELAYLLKMYQLEKHITILNKVPQAEVYKLMQSSHLFLLPSLEEGLPNVLIEAMAIGLPVIATDCGGVSELIDETTGTLITTRDPQCIANAIIAFNKRPLEEITTQRTNARNKVLNQHTIGKMVKDMEQLYFEVLDRV